MSDDNRTEATFEDVEIGDYAMKGDTPVRIEDVSESEARGGKIVGVEYVSGNGECCGGSSFWWPVRDLRPITDPLHKAAVKLYESRRRLDNAKKAQAAAEEDIAKWRGVVEVLRDGK